MRHQQFYPTSIKGHNALFLQSVAAVILFNSYFKVAQVPGRRKACCYNAVTLSSSIFVAEVAISLCILQSSMRTTKGLAKCGRDGSAIVSKSLFSFCHLRDDIYK
jgi:hypothetical protein